MKKITIVGGGNIGTQFAVHCAEKGHEVIISTSKPESFSHELVVQNQRGEAIHKGKIKCATSDDEIAFLNADVIFVTLPAYCMKDIADRIAVYANENMSIGLIPGTGGGECAFSKCISKGAAVFGMQRVPSVARLVEYGKRVCAVGYREKLHVAALPKSKCKECAALVASIFGVECAEVPEYLNLTLTPSNPILHTTRLRSIFEEYKDGVTYDAIPLFYEEWSDETSRLLFKCDDEVQQICRALNEFDLSYVKSLKLHYESATPEALTAKIRSIEGFKGLPTPSVLKDGKYIPDLTSRYFTADFSYGLTIINQIADLLNLSVPNIRETMDWYKKIEISHQEFSFAEYGITDRKTFCEFYSF